MDRVLNTIVAASRDKTRLARGHAAASLHRIARAGPVMEASQWMIARTYELLGATAGIINIGHASESAPLRHSTNSNSSA